MIRPEVQLEIDATRAAFSALRGAVMAHAQRPVGHLKRAGAWLLRLDRLYANATGAVLKRSTAPEYTGPMYEWRSTRSEVKIDVVAALERLRAGRQATVIITTEFFALNYFSAIWPADLEWPSDIPRPPKAKREAA